MDDKGNVYVADTMNLAIRKIGDAGVTTIAGGKSNVAGYRDGPSEDAQFSNDFDVVYVRPTCSLLVIDRGNAALRQIFLNQDDCDYQYSSVSPTDILMVLGAILLGYATCLLQQGFGPSFFRRMQPSDTEFREQPSKEKPTPIVETLKEEPGWPSFGQLVFDLSKLALEAMASMFLYFVPSRFQSKGSKKCLTPMEDSLRMPEDEAPPSLVQRQTTPAPVSETRQTHSTNTSDKYSEMKSLKIKSISFREPSLSGKHRSSKRQEYAEFYRPGEVPPNDKNLPEDEAPPSLVQRQITLAPVSETHQMHSTNTSDKYSEMKSLKIKSISFREPSLLSKHRSSKRQEYAEFYGPGEVPSYSKSKTQKERTRHRLRDKTGEVDFGTGGTDQKPVEPKPVDYNNSKFDHYNMRSKYGSSDSSRF
ncbi:hypothetical protein DITRI_Ditri07aG0013100 [Diplodiscus trichospermus]